MHVDAAVGGRETAGAWLAAWAGRMLVAACLAAGWGAATLAPVLVPDVASAASGVRGPESDANRLWQA
ncbi:MAG: hypothetical protein EBZ59_10700, partial [Planctomycetia bacterium]|nr:hypothetical protein [Planctomycetia bacterium]